MVGPKAYYPPMRKIYCDRRAISSKTGQHFFRVQGTKGWIVDKGLTHSRINSGNTISMLLPESNVRTGLFAFRCRRRIAVRMQADEFVAPTVIDKGQIVVADIVREPLDYENNCNTSDEDGEMENDSEIDRSDGSNNTFVIGDFPHLRLSDGSGWIFKSKTGGEFLEEVTLEMGSWKLQCISSTPVKLF